MADLLGVDNPDADYNSIYELAKLVLDSIVGVYEQAGVDLPARRYVNYGAVSADCEQLTVSVSQHYTGTVGGDPNEISLCNSPRVLVMTVQLFRKAPVIQRQGSFPSTDSLDSAARIHFRDAYLLVSGSDQAYLNYMALPKVGMGMGGTSGFISEVSPVDTAGGFVGSSLSLAMPLY